MSQEAETQEPVNDVVAEHQLPDNLKKHYLRAESAMELRNWSYAVTLLQAVLSKEPGFLDGRRKLRQAAIKQNEGKKGVKLGAEALKVLKMQSHVKKDPLGVIVALEKDVLASDPYNPQANELLYEAAVAAGLPMTAGFALETVTQGHPDNTKFYHKLGDFYLDREAFDEAAEIFQKLVDKDRADLEATKKFKDATARGSISSQKWDSDGDWRDLLKDKDAAKDLESKGRAAMTPEMLQTQVDSLLQDYGADNQNLEVTKQLADTYEQLEQFESSLQFYDWALHLSANDPSLERKCAMIRERVESDKLIELRKFIEENPEHPEVERCKADLAEAEKSQLGNLIAESETRVERNPTDMELRFELGERLFRAGRSRDAVQHLQQATRSPNLRIRVMNMLGKCYDNMGMTDLAAQQFEDAIKELTAMDETKKELLYNLGLLYKKLESDDKYLECLKQIYAVDYGYKDVAERVEKSYGG